MPPRLKFLSWLAFLATVAFIAWTQMVSSILGPDTPSRRYPTAQEDIHDSFGRIAEGTKVRGPLGPRPAGNPGTWLSTFDYPAAAWRSDAEGVLHFTLAVDAFGEVADCRITQTSGNKQLDDRACAALRTRGRFYPAIDKDGQPVAGTWKSSVRWELPR